MVNKCEKCGWEYPITHTEKRCRFCGTVFKNSYCIACGAFGPVRDRHLCHRCDNAYRAMRYKNNYLSRKGVRLVQRKQQQRTAEFEAWLQLIANLPFKPLSQDEWLDACMTFSSCAVCGDESIEARAFFIPYYYGGRYSKWNVIPVCETCAMKLRRRQNPWISMPDSVKRITAYLRPIIDEVLENVGETKDSI